MARPALLSPDEVRERTAELPDWECDGRSLCRTFRFADFGEAFGFMARVALAAEKHDHHPEWSNVYATVEVRWTTHDAGGLTELDLRLAALCDRAAGA